MKKPLALFLTVLLALAFFTGCGGNSDTDISPASTTPEQESSGPEASAADDNSPYKFPIGKYDVDADGFPTAAYEYDLPLSTSDEVFTMWTVCWTPQYVPEDGYGSMQYPTYLAEQTGVNIEYSIVTSDNRQANFAVLLAADDLCDISSSAYSFYSGTVRSSIDDGWFVNLYDYKDYMPNYMYQAASRDNVDVWSKIFYDTDIITSFYNMYADPLPNTGYCIRKDFCDKWGVDASTIDTFDELHSALQVFKANDIESPMEIFNTIELTPGFGFSGYNTSAWVNQYGLPTARKDLDGQIEFTLTTEDDRDLMTMLSTWYSEDLIDKNWAANENTTLMNTPITTDQTGVCVFNPGEVADFESQTANPDCNWIAMPRLKKTSDEKIMFGQSISQFSYGSWTISAKCSNIPLLVTYCDWFYSPNGSLITSYGVPGLTWDYNEDGDIRLTDFVLNNPDGIGLAWTLVLYANNGLADAGLQILTRKYAYDGGDRLKAMHYVWVVDGYEGEMDVPASLTFTEEQENELNQYTNEISTYINETYLAFLDGSKPMSEWDQYVSEVKALGLDRCCEIYQDAYDSFMVRFS